MRMWLNLSRAAPTDRSRPFDNLKKYAFCRLLLCKFATVWFEFGNNYGENETRKTFLTTVMGHAAGGWPMETLLMAILSSLFLLLFRAFIVVLPLAIAWLALRRLLSSRSSNVWIYAATCLLTAVVFVAMLPWAFMFAPVNWLVFLLAFFSPAIWLGVVMICDPLEEKSKYDPVDIDDDDDVEPITFRRNPVPGKPLILEKPHWPDTPMPMFRHNRSAFRTSTPRVDEQSRPSLLSIAKNMRGNVSSDKRRPKLLPSPKHFDSDLSFLPRNRVTRP